MSGRWMHSGVAFALMAAALPAAAAPAGAQAPTTATTKRRPPAAAAAPTTATRVQAVPTTSTRNAAQPTTAPATEARRPEPGPTTLRRWRDVDRRLLERTERFRRTEGRREQLIAALGQSRGARQGGQMDPASALARQTADRQLAELHRLVEQGRADSQEAVCLLMLLIHSHDRWAPQLARQIDLALAKPDPESPERERLRTWRGALERLSTGDLRGFLDRVLGEEFASYLVESSPMLLGGEEEGESAAAPGRTPAPRRPADQQEWLRRVEQLEAQNDALRQALELQDQEIRRLRRVIDGPPLEN